jgi:hypothetical protein
MINVVTIFSTENISANICGTIETNKNKCKCVRYTFLNIDLCKNYVLALFDQCSNIEELVA